MDPDVAHLVRAEYCELMEEIFNNRKEILANYFKSIGITSSAQKAWSDLQSKIKPMSFFKCQPMALK